MAANKGMSVKGRCFAAGVLIAALFFITILIYFQSHFYPGTKINGISVAFRTAAEADKLLTYHASSYQLELYERGNITERIPGYAIQLKFNLEGGSAALKQAQNKTPLVMAIFKKNALTIGDAYSFNEYLLRECYSNLGCTDGSKVIEPKNAELVYSDGTYKIVKEIYGNKVNDAVLYQMITHCLSNGISQLDLEKMGCYFNPQILAGSMKTIETKAMAEFYLTSEIVYTYNGGRETVDKEEISQWIEFDSELNIVFNAEKMKEFVVALSEHYNTYGKKRDFITSTGLKKEVNGGDYGWKVDVAGEIEALANAIRKGDTQLKEPVYSQKGAVQGANDIGYTYVEIDLTKQHLWFYKSGFLVARGDVVTGNIKKGHDTPEGVYSLKYKVEDAILRGENYRSKVSYWMPFNNNIGIHDAPWRTEFGRDIYLSRGSHGCVNVTLGLAKKIYENIEPGTPVICYY